MVTVYFSGTISVYCGFSVTLFAGIVKVMVALVVSTSAGRPVTSQPVKV